MTEELISLSEYAKIHGIDPATVRQRALRSAYRTARKIGRIWVIDKNEPHIDHRLKAGMKVKYFKVCRVRCLICGDLLEHENKTKQDNHSHALWCSCGKTMLDPAATLYRVGGDPSQFEDLSEEWPEGQEV